MQVLSHMAHKFYSYCFLTLISLVIATNMGACASCGKSTTKGTSSDNNDNQEEQNKTVELVLTPAGKTSIIAMELIQLAIANKGNQSTTVRPTLQITRTKGSHATIQHAVDIGNGKYELLLNDVPAKNSITQDVVVVAGEDIQATFELQLTYQGQHVGSKVIINWEKGIAIELKDVKYDQASGYITCGLENSGSKAVSQLKIKYASKTAGLQVAGKALTQDQEITVTLPDSLNPGSKKENIQLAKLGFGANHQAAFEFTVLYEGGATLPIQYMLAPTPLQINLALKLTYDKNKQELTYTINNTGDNIAKDVKLVYNNVSNNVAEKNVLLAGEKKGETAAQDLAAQTGELTRTLAVGFNTQPKATFEFKVICQGTTLEHLTQRKELEAPLLEIPNLMLTHNGSKTNEINLKYDEQEATIKIEAQVGSELPKLPEPIELQITRTVGTSGYLSQESWEHKSKEEDKVVIQQLDRASTKRSFYVYPKTDDELEFRLQLFYNKQPIGNSMTIKWKAKEVKLNLSWVAPRPNLTNPQFVQLGKDQKVIEFKVYNEEINEVADPDQLKLRIEKNKGSKAIIAETWGGTEVTGLTVGKIGYLGKNFVLHIDPQTDASLSLKLQLYYKEKPQGTPLKLGWGIPEKTDDLELLREQVTSFLQAEDLQKAVDVFTVASSSYQAADEKIVKGIYENLLQKVEEGIQTNADHNASKALKVAEVAESLSNNKLPFVEVDKTKEIAKKAYKAALDELDKELISKPSLPADQVLKETKKLAALPKEYGLDTTKVAKVTKAAYETAAQACARSAGNYATWLANMTHNLNEESYTKQALEEANKAAELAKQAKKDGYESEEINRAVKEAHVAAAKTELQIAKVREKYVKYGGKDFAGDLINCNQASKAATKAAAIAEKAVREGFGSTELTETIQQAYKVAADTALAAAKGQQETAYVLNVLQNTSALVSKAAELAQEAEKKGFKSEQLSQAVKQAFVVKAEAAVRVLDNKQQELRQCKMESPLLMVRCKDVIEALNQVVEVAQGIEKEGFGNQELTKTVQKAYVTAAQAMLHIVKLRQAAIGQEEKGENNKFIIQDYVQDAKKAATEATSLSNNIEKRFNSENFKDTVQKTIEAANKLEEDIKIKSSTEATSQVEVGTKQTLEAALAFAKLAQGEEKDTSKNFTKAIQEAYEKGGKGGGVSNYERSLQAVYIAQTTAEIAQSVVKETTNKELQQAIQQTFIAAANVTLAFVKEVETEINKEENYGFKLVTCYDMETGADRANIIMEAATKAKVGDSVIAIFQETCKIALDVSLSIVKAKKATTVDDVELEKDIEEKVIKPIQELQDKWAKK